MSFCTVVLPAELGTWRPDVFPGTTSQCTCPTAQPWPNALIFDENCVVHTLLVRSAWLRFASPNFFPIGERNV